MLFDRICRDNAITHRLTEPSSPTTTGKVERFHGSFRREFLNHAEPFDSVLTAQAAVDTWVTGYNCDRPHQALDMDYPAQRFAPAVAVVTKVVGDLPNLSRYALPTCSTNPSTALGWAKAMMQPPNPPPVMRAP